MISNLDKTIGFVLELDDFASYLYLSSEFNIWKVIYWSAHDNATSKQVDYSSTGIAIPPMSL